jgi:NAD(P)-dependent dehydrogenase (short-subunit alcohol dehydrogenase family)
MAGQRGESRTAAREWARYGINGNVINPASLFNALVKFHADFPPPAGAKAAQNFPLRRLGDPLRDIAPVADDGLLMHP